MTPSLLRKLPRSSSKMNNKDGGPDMGDEDQDLESSGAGDGGTDGEPPSQETTDNQSVLRLLEEGEKVSCDWYIIINRPRQINLSFPFI